MRCRSFIFICISLLAVCARADTADEQLATVERMIQAWNAQEWERVYESFAQDGVLHSMMTEPVVGREAIKQRLAALVASVPRIELRVVRMGIADGVVFMERVDEYVRGEERAAVPVVGVIEVENGRVKAWREYYDRAQLLQAMGVSGNEAARPR
jgi:limonene-1,2-epoxide hydrolase